MADVSASTIIIDSEAKFDPIDLELYQMQRKFAGNNVSIPIPEKYSSFTEMIQDQPPLPDPEFKEGDVQPIIEDVGAALDKIEKHEVEFKKLVEDMFEDSKGFQKLTQDEIELRMVARKENGLSKMMIMTQKGNEGCVGILSAAEQAIYTSQHQNSPVYNPMSEASASVVIPTIEEANNDTNGRPHEVDSWTTLVA